MELSQSQLRVSRGLLVELDAILDTRLAMVRKLYGSEVAEDLSRNVLYRTRKTDILSKVDPRINDTEFMFEYSKRDKELLDFSKRSLISEYLNQLIVKIQSIIDSNNPLISDVDVFINVYPYQLSKEESYYISAGIQSVIELGKPPTMVYLEPKEITIGYLEQNNIFTYVLYDFNSWVSAAMPDKNGETIEEIGLRRVDNLTVIASNLVINEDKLKEVEDLLREYNLPFAINDIGNIPWALLFTLDLIDPIFFTEYDEQIAGKIMSVISKSSSPINVEIALISEYCKLIERVQTPREVINGLIERGEFINSEIRRCMFSEDFDHNLMRTLVAEQRFNADMLSVYIPSDPATDYERFVDSKMSCFDTTQEFSEISENHWNKLGIPCKRLTHEIKELDKVAYLLVVAEDVTDANGVFRSKGDLLPSVNKFDPILDDLSEAEVEEFKKEIQSCKPLFYQY